MLLLVHRRLPRIARPGRPMNRPATAALAAIFVLAGCTDAPDVRSSTTPSPTHAATTSSPIQADYLDDHFDVGGGRLIHLRCQGTGSPTIVLEAGGASGSEDWPGAITQPLSKRTRTCKYDRAGTGTSHQPPQRRRLMVDVANDLEAVLSAADIDGPLLLVGASFGGVAALHFALTHPNRTAGLVILDTDWPTTDFSLTSDKFLPAALLAEIRAQDRWDAADNIERIDYQATTAEVAAAFHPLPDIPIIVLTALRSIDCFERSAAECASVRAENTRLQGQWRKLGPRVVQRTVDSTHDITEEAPNAALEQILAALDEVRS